MLSSLLAPCVRAIFFRLAVRLTALALLLAPFLSAWPLVAEGASAGLPVSPAPSSPIGPTVKEVIEFTRIVQPLGHDNDALQTQISPDGRRAFLVTRKADVRTDLNRFEILLLDVAPEHLASAPPAKPVRLLAIEGAQDNDDNEHQIREARWVGNDTIAFRGRLKDRPYQAYRLDVASRRLEQLTHEPLGILNFDVSHDLRRVVYVAPVLNPPMPAGARSLVVGTTSFWSVHFGQDDTRRQQRRFRYRFVEVGKSARTLGESFPESSNGIPATSISPDGRWAVLPRYEPERQLAWGDQYPLVAQYTSLYGPARKLDPLAYFSGPSSYVPRRFVAYRLADGKARPVEQAVIDAPDDSRPGGQTRADRLWSAVGHSLLIAGTHLPPAAASAVVGGAAEGDVREGNTGQRDVAQTASHVVEYWPDSGRWQDVAVLEQTAQGIYPVVRERDAFVVLDGTKQRRFQRAAEGRWQEVKLDVASVAGSPSTQVAPRALHIDESLNQPPDVFATVSGGQVVRLTDLNPQYSVGNWGSMRPYAWKDSKDRLWEGGLMVPAGYDSHARYPLVIQTYGFDPARFYRDGSNDYEGFTSGFAGRAFLREGVLVLAFPWRASSGAPDGQHEAIVALSEGVKGAIDALVAEGVVDREQIGIMGWSATGERVLNTLTFSDAPIRAATMMDGDANTLFSMTITYAVRDSIQLRKEEANQGGPYGASLASWIRNDPSLHTDCIRAALRMETYGPEVHNNWDIYALLRRQYKPAEFIFFPQGAHALARPKDRMISLQGNVDWYRFWLKDEKRSDVLIPGETAASLSEQYRRWDQMAELKRADDAKPACVRASRGG